MEAKKMNQEIVKKIKKFRNERNWEQFHSGENLAKSIVIEAAELLEIFQWSKEGDSKKIKDELADVFIYSILLAEKYELDLEKIIIEKIIKNEKKYPIEKSFGNAKKSNEL